MHKHSYKQNIFQTKSTFNTVHFDAHEGKKKAERFQMMYFISPHISCAHMHGNEGVTVNCVKMFHSISIADCSAEKLVSLLHKAVSRNACQLTAPLPSAALSK